MSDLGAAIKGAARLRSVDAEASMDDNSRAMVKRLQRMSDGAHYRVDLALDWANGVTEICLSDTGLVHTVKLDLQRPYTGQVAGSDMVRIRIADQGYSEFAPPNGDWVGTDGPGAMIILEPAGQPPSSSLLDGHIRLAEVSIHRSALAKLYGADQSCLPPLVRSFLDGSLCETVVQSLPLTAALWRCLDDLHDSAQQGVTRRIYMESKALEIFCLAFDVLNAQGALPLDASATTRRGVLKAQQILTAGFASPPSLDELAHEVGVSRSRLIAGFREVTGQSVFDYVHELRMQQALALLSEGDASITEIAYSLGYNHPSSFTVAVQRRFGVTPRQLRQARQSPSKAAPV